MKQGKICFVAVFSENVNCICSTYGREKIMNFPMNQHWTQICRRLSTRSPYNNNRGNEQPTSICANPPNQATASSLYFSEYVNFICHIVANVFLWVWQQHNYESKTPETTTTTKNNNINKNNKGTNLCRSSQPCQQGMTNFPRMGTVQRY